MKLSDRAELVPFQLFQAKRLQQKGAEIRVAALAVSRLIKLERH